MDEVLTAQERRIMDLLFAQPGLTVAEVNEQLDDGSTYASTRAALSRLVQKRQLRSDRRGVRYVYTPVADSRTAGRGAVKRVMDTFFGGSPVATIDAVLGFSTDRLSDDELDELKNLIEAARSERGRKGRRS